MCFWVMDGLLRITTAIQQISTQNERGQQKSQIQKAHRLDYVPVLFNGVSGHVFLQIGMSHRLLYSLVG